MRPIYLDYNATTPVDLGVLTAMLPYFQEEFGNPSSTHAYGKRAQDAVARARGQVASLLGAEPDEIVFTGGGTEATNHGLKGVVLEDIDNPLGRCAGHIVTSAIEHPATLQTCDYFRRLGCRVIIVPVDRAGQVDPDQVRHVLRRGTALVSIMHANNEVGTIQRIREIADLAHASGALMHTDAAQSAGKIAVNVGELGVDLLSLAGHKMYAPKGVGALYVRRGVKLEALLHGAGHEAGRRAGTENVPSVVGLGAACAVAASSQAAAEHRLRELRDRLWRRLEVKLGDRVILNGHLEQRLPNTLSVNFIGHVGAELLARTPEVAASTGSACHEGMVQISPVLEAMGVPAEMGRGAVRLSVGRFTTAEEVDQAAEALCRSSLATG